MKLFRLDTEQILPASLDEVWAFFSDPAGLPLITPPWLRFRILSPLPDRIRPDLLLEYRVRPFPLLSLRWVTRIGAVEPPHRFVDEQVAGPYRFWHHEHRFEPCAGGVRALDTVHYALPFGALGAGLQPLIVRPRLGAIFSFRRSALAARFPGRS